MVDPILTNPDTSQSIGDAWLITNAIGDIQELSADAARLLNLSQRGARGRNLARFFLEDRPKLLAELLRIMDEGAIERMGTLQPRDRRPVRVRIDVSPEPGKPGDRVSLRWIISADRR